MITLTLALILFIVCIAFVIAFYITAAVATILIAPFKWIYERLSEWLNI